MVSKVLIFSELATVRVKDYKIQTEYDYNYEHVGIWMVTYMTTLEIRADTILAVLWSHSHSYGLPTP